MASKPKFTAASFAQRFLIGLAIIFPAYNPTGYSVSHWCLGHDNGPLSAKVVVVLALAIVYVAVFRIVLSAFRWTGLIAASLFAVLLGFEIVTHVLVATTDSSWIVAQYVVLTAAVVVIAFGTSWSNLTQWLTGQQAKWYVR